MKRETFINATYATTRALMLCGLVAACCIAFYGYKARLITSPTHLIFCATAVGAYGVARAGLDIFRAIDTQPTSSSSIITYSLELMFFTIFGFVLSLLLPVNIKIVQSALWTVGISQLGALIYYAAVTIVHDGQAKRANDEATSRAAE